MSPPTDLKPLKKFTMKKYYPHEIERAKDYLREHFNKKELKEMIKDLGISKGFAYKLLDEVGYKKKSGRVIEKKIVRPPAVYSNRRSLYPELFDLL